MLKKSLIAVAVLACALPAFAGDIKIHEWPCTYVPQQVAKLDVVLDVGYYVKIVDQKAIKVEQDSTNSDPYHTYVGCKTTSIVANFAGTLTATIAGVAPANGTWTITSGSPQAFGIGSTPWTICVKGTKVAIENLTGGAKAVKVAEVTVFVVPV